MASFLKNIRPEGGPCYLSRFILFYEKIAVSFFAKHGGRAWLMYHPQLNVGHTHNIKIKIKRT